MLRLAHREIPADESGVKTGYSSACFSMAWPLSRQAHSTLTLYSRSLASPAVVRATLWPSYENPESKRLGRKFFKVQARGDAMARWYALSFDHHSCSDFVLALVSPSSLILPSDSLPIN